MTPEEILKMIPPQSDKPFGAILGGLIGNLELPHLKDVEWDECEKTEGRTCSWVWLSTNVNSMLKEYVCPEAFHLFSCQKCYKYVQVEAGGVFPASPQTFKTHTL